MVHFFRFFPSTVFICGSKSKTEKLRNRAQSESNLMERVFVSNECLQLGLLEWDFELNGASLLPRSLDGPGEPYR